MRILAILWTACLVRLCSAGCLGGGTRDDEVTDQAEQGGSNEVSTENISTPPTQQGQAAKPATPVTQSAGQGDDAIDLAHPDMTKVDILRASRNEVEKKEYYPTGASKVTSVVDGDKELWKKDEDYQKFLSATLSSKGKS
ncbi:signal peptide-containing protein [Theileria equi strain WA]|uniref:Signal peptide-containing protein n=1 Tax=Theileria equi strain WA TaxID=1537102 RepID=L0AYT5_THEEQ|nr:signal peptide-containing protein [Theileria equi strain WA]XP_004830396.1 signal peptide-containing protein [Theileria equi strain WA]AFZ80729.1 signal peptide-containing protein [Theileria equi strain WA]AFZ80730.1 signal peptide-containing protein [Theileria equi strain WA]|eukprot:XP_004830395.1 signal peptide-containing protein [Theileria equi strain WA]